MEMRAVVFDEGKDGRQIMLRNLPAPGLGDYDVLYKVDAFGLNQADLLLTRGQHYVSADLPMRLGYEGAGCVVAVGDKVSRFKPGDCVASIPNVDGHYAAGGELALAHEDFLSAWPGGFSAEEAAGFWMQYLTAYYPLAELFAVKPGDWVMITAATGGAGVGAIKMARLLGARVIATTRTPESKGAFLKEQGAECVVQTGGAGMVEEVRAATGGDGVQLICDSLCGSHVAVLAQALADQGVLYVHGGLSGEMEVSVPVLDLVRRGAGIYGYSLINELRKPGALARGRDFVLDAIAAGKLPRPAIDKVFPFEAAPEAYARLCSGVQRGKIVVALGARD